MASTTASNIATINTDNMVKSKSLTAKALERLRKDKVTVLALVFFFGLTILAYSAPLIERAWGVSYILTDVPNRFAPSCIPVLGIGATECSARHVFGTDDLGRDFFMRLLYGGQISLAIAFAAAIISIIIGVSLGMITGYFGGIIDDFVTWLITTINSIPSLFLLLIISAVLISNDDLRQVFGGPSTLIIVLGLLGWTGTTRLVRGETLSLREREFIVSARALGASPMRIIYYHIMPNLLSVVIITLALDIGGLILTEAALSYLGFGVKAPTPTWGNMLNEAADYYRDYPHMMFLPGFFIFVTVLSLYLIGDGLRDAFDPTAKD
jgi:peptide/nickel transport system permease protein